jgi:hypothetical protein
LRSAKCGAVDRGLRDGGDCIFTVSGEIIGPAQEIQAENALTAINTILMDHPQQF